MNDRESGREREFGRRLFSSEIHFWLRIHTQLFVRFQSSCIVTSAEASNIIKLLAPHQVPECD